MQLIWYGRIEWWGQPRRVRRRWACDSRPRPSLTPLRYATWLLVALDATKTRLQIFEQALQRREMGRDRSRQQRAAWAAVEDGD